MLPHVGDNHIRLYKTKFGILALKYLVLCMVGLNPLPTCSSAVISKVKSVVWILSFYIEEVIQGERWLALPIPQVDAEGVSLLWGKAVYPVVA